MQSGLKVKEEWSKSERRVEWVKEDRSERERRVG